MNKLLLIAALAMTVNAKDHKACIEVTKSGANKIRFFDDLGKKHTLTLANLSEDGPDALLEIRANAGILASKEVIIETSDHKLVSLGVVDSTCKTRSRSEVVMN
jgi:hypothetical protein